MGEFFLGGGKGGGSIGPPDIFVTDGPKRDYICRASQRARGATKHVQDNDQGQFYISTEGREQGLTKVRWAGHRTNFVGLMYRYAVIDIKHSYNH